MTDLFQLVMRSGPNPGTTFKLEGGLITIGRDASNSISINDVEVSRSHAQLTFQGGKYVLEDKGSTNGTFVNGQRLAGPHVMKSGELISLGEQIVLMFEVESSDPNATLASAPKAAQVRAAAAAAQSQSPAPKQNYAGQIPAGPAPAPVTPAEPGKKSNVLPIVIGVAALLFVCACGLFFYYVDANYLWCNFFPFIPGCG